MGKLSQTRAPIYEALERFRRNRIVPFDVPGHKHGRGNPELVELLGERCVSIDVNSMKPLDNLCHPVSVIKEAEELAAAAFGADHAFLMVGGTTSAVQSMILSCCKKNDKIILPRNVHRSAINAMVLCGAKPVYVNPDVDQKLGISLGMRRQDVLDAIEKNPDAVAVLVNNPTYYGICSDLRAIVKAAHEKGMLVLADEAHGTHFYFGKDLPVSAMEAGADIIECNFSCPNMTKDGLGSDVGTDPNLVESYTAAARSGTALPILAKMTPNITSMEPAARAAVRGGADGMAAINTIKSVMNVSLENFTSEPDVCGKSAEGGYSGKAVKPIALRFIRDLMSDPELKNVPVSGMGGIETWRDAAEFIALGCSTVQITTAVMEYGYRIIRDLKSGLEEYLSSSGLLGIDALVGRALPGIVDTGELDRDTICYPAFDRSLCVGCGRCYLSCMDGGHQALIMKDDRKPSLIREKCVGCHLCVNVCPMKSISPGPRVSKK